MVEESAVETAITTPALVLRVLPPPALEKLVLLIAGTVQSLIGAAVFVGIYAAEIHGSCLYKFTDTDFDVFRDTSDICAAPFWVTSITQSCASWGVQMGACGVILVLVHHKIFYMIMSLLSVAFVTGNAVVVAVYAGLQIPAFPYVLTPAVLIILTTPIGVCCFRGYRRPSAPVPGANPVPVVVVAPTSPSTANTTVVVAKVPTDAAEPLLPVAK